MISKKICLIGDFAVGKTSLVRRFVDRQFDDHYLTTVGVKISKKQLTTSLDQKLVQLMIWDIEGKTPENKIPANYVLGASGAIIVADLTRQETVAHLEDHLRTFFRANPQGLVVVALNKADLVPLEQQSQFCLSQVDSKSAQILQSCITSAKTGKDVDRMFQQLADGIMQ